MPNDLDNPFLSNLPQVIIARAVRQIGSEAVTTPDTACRRIWCRVGNHRVLPPVRPMEEIAEASGALGRYRGLDKLQPY